MRSTADNRYASFIAILVIAIGLMVLAHQTGHQWAALLTVPLATIVWLETNLRRGRIHGSSLATVHDVARQRTAQQPQGNAELFDLAAHRALREPRRQELSEDHVAPILAVDFPGVRQSSRIRVGA